MQKLKKMLGIVAMGTMLVGGLLALPGDALANTVGNSTYVGSAELGVSYGAYTGLGTQDIRVTIARIIRAALGLLGIVTVVIIIYGGFLWMTAGGNDEQVGKAKKCIYYGIIGLVIIFAAYALTQFIFNQIITATTTDTGPINTP
jgi:hypothetical protein